MTVRHGLATSALVGAMIVAASPARAQPAPPAEDTSADAASTTARARYNAGSKAFGEKRFVEAALDFEAAASEKPSPVALYTAALAWEQANVPDRAADDYARCLSVPGLPADKVGPAKDRLAALEGFLGAVTVSGPEGTRVQLDANSEVPVPAGLHGTAGVHTLSVRASGQPITRRPVVLERGKPASVDLTKEPAPPQTGEGKKDEPPPPPPAAAPAPSGDSGAFRHAVGFTALGVGGALLLSGAVLGAETVGATHAFRGAPSQGTYDHAAEMEMWTNVAFIAGGVLAAGGIALVVWPSSHPSAPAAAGAEGISLVPAPGGAFLRGSF